MSLQKILETLEAEAERQIEAIEQVTQAEIARIETEAKAEAAVARHAHMPEIQTPLRAERARILNQAKLAALQQVMGTREALIREVVEAAGCQLAAMDSTERYAQVLTDLTREAFDTLDAHAQLRLRTRASDVAMLEGIVRNLGLAATVESGLENGNYQAVPSGGLLAETSDGRITLVNTLAARLQRVAVLYRAQIADQLLGQARED